MRKYLSLFLAACMMPWMLAACGTETDTAVEHHPDFVNVDVTDMTDLQKAVILTAETYVHRGAWGQYDDTRITASKDPVFYRWSTGQMEPEDYTSQNTGYSNCAAFVRDLYLAALDWDIQYYTTATMMSGCKKILVRAPVSEGFATKSQEELETIKQEFLAALQPGDLVVYRYADKNSGHVMCYVGNGMMIHCTGSNYDYSMQIEKYEESGCFRYDTIDTFWDATQRRYLFNKLSYAIVRPLDDFTGEIPQRTLDRMTTMRGVVAEKTASNTWAQTVNPGQEVTFTFTLRNLTGEKKKLTVTDTVPQNTTYLSGAEKQNGENLSWKVTLPPQETVTLSYTVRVEDSAKVVKSESFVENVPVNCPELTVGKTLTLDQQETLRMVLTKTDTFDGDGLTLAAQLYEEAFGTDVLSGLTGNDLLAGIFRFYDEDIATTKENQAQWPSPWQVLDEKGAYYSLVAPGLYGGRNVLEGSAQKPYSKTDFMATKRTRLLAQEQLIPGDIILASDGEDTFHTAAWLYTGEHLMNLQNGMTIAPEPMLEQFLCYQYFAVIRPSLGM